MPSTSGRASRRPAAGEELFRPRAALTGKAQPLAQLSFGQWFFGWCSHPDPAYSRWDAINYGGDSFIFGPNRSRLPFQAPRLPRRGRNIEPDEDSTDLGDYGLSARWSPTWLDGTLGFYFRNTTDTVPQLMATPGVVPGVPSATCSAIGTPLPGNLCLVTPATSVADLSATSSASTTRPTQRHQDLRRVLSKKHTGRQCRRRAVLSPGCHWSDAVRCCQRSRFARAGLDAR
jgi:hypothetical protein